MTPKEKTERSIILTTAHNDFEKGLNIYAFWKIKNHATGEDLVQDTFVKTWAYLVKGGKIELMKAFLYHILNHLIIDEYRKRKTTSLDTLIEKGFEPPVEYQENMFNAMDAKALLILIQRLPVKYIKIMRMKHIQDLTLQEMSLITGQTKNAIAVQTHRGLEKLKKLYLERDK